MFGVVGRSEREEAASEAVRREHAKNHISREVEERERPVQGGERGRGSWERGELKE